MQTTMPVFLAQAQSQSMMPMLVTMVLVFGIFYFLMIRPQQRKDCLLYTSPSPRDRTRSSMPSSA